jgi:glucokinase
MPRSPDRIVLVFDVGGTRMRAALYDEPRGALRNVRRREAPQSDERGRLTLYRAIADLGREVLEGRSPGIVAVAFPGPLDPSGRALAAPTLWGRSGSGPIPVRDEIAALWPGASVHVLNDVTAAGYRFVDEVAGDFCVLTVSSGIGHKVFACGRPLVGPEGRGGEIGHWRVDTAPDAPVCDCGARGHLGALASGRAVPGQVRALVAADEEAFRRSVWAGASDRITNESLASAFREGDAWTARLVGRMAEPLGTALAALHLGVGVESFVILGGFALSLGAGYRRALVRAAASASWALGQDWDRMIRLGDVEEEAGLLGAGRFAARDGGTSRGRR